MSHARYELCVSTIIDLHYAGRGLSVGRRGQWYLTGRSGNLCAGRNEAARNDAVDDSQSHGVTLAERMIGMGAWGAKALRAFVSVS